MNLMAEKVVEHSSHFIYIKSAVKFAKKTHKRDNDEESNRKLNACSEWLHSKKQFSIL